MKLKRFVISISILMVFVYFLMPINMADAEAAKVLDFTEYKAVKEIGRQQGISFSDSTKEEKFYRSFVQKHKGNVTYVDFKKNGIKSVTKVGSKLKFLFKASAIGAVAGLLIDFASSLESDPYVTYPDVSDFPADNIIGYSNVYIDTTGNPIRYSTYYERYYYDDALILRYFNAINGTWQSRSTYADSQVSSVSLSLGDVFTNSNGTYQYVNVNSTSLMGSARNYPVAVPVGSIEGNSSIVTRGTEITDITVPNEVTEPSEDVGIDVDVSNDPNPTWDGQPITEGAPETPPVGEPGLDLSVPSEPTLNFDPLKVNIGSITNKFPFSIPWDLKRQLDVFNVQPDAPSFTLNFSKFPGVNSNLTYDLSFEKFNAIANIIRWFTTILVDIGFILMIRRLMPE